MNRRIAKVSLAAALGFILLAAGACTRTQHHMATGAALGIGGGAIVAAATGGSAMGGAILGGALGTGAGYLASR